MTINGSRQLLRYKSNLFQVQAHSLYSFTFPGGSLIKGKLGEEGNLCHNLYVYYEEVIFIPLFYENYLFFILFFSFSFFLIFKSLILTCVPKCMRTI